MVNLICGLFAVVIVTLFLGGLAESIWHSTNSLAFPIITAIVLIAIFVDFWQGVKSGSGNKD